MEEEKRSREQKREKAAICSNWTSLYRKDVSRRSFKQPPQNLCLGRQVVKCV